MSLKFSASRVKRNNIDCDTNRPRAVAMKLLLFKDETKIFQNVNKLKRQNIVIYSYKQ